MYVDIVFTSIPHASARLANNSGVCILWAPEIISSPTRNQSQIRPEDFEIPHQLDISWCKFTEEIIRIQVVKCAKLKIKT